MKLAGAEMLTVLFIFLLELGSIGFLIFILTRFHQRISELERFRDRVERNREAEPTPRT